MNKKDHSAWKVLLTLVDSQRTRLLISVIFSSVAAALELVPFIILFHAIEILQKVFLLETVESGFSVYADDMLALGTWMMLAIITKHLVYIIAYALTHQSAFLILTHTRILLTTKLAFAPQKWLKEHHSGELKESIVQDVAKLENFIAHHMVEVVVALVGPILVTIYLCLIHWQLALAALFSAPAALFVALLTMKKMASHYDNYHHATVTLNSTVIEFIRNSSVMRVFRQSTNRFTRLTNTLSDYASTVEVITHNTVTRWALFSSLLGSSVLFVLPTGIYLVETQRISTIDVALAILLSAGMLRPLLKIVHFFSEIQDILSSVAHFIPILQIKKSSKNKPDIELDTSVELTVKNVNFSYGDKALLQNIQLTFAPSTTSFILGSSGSGKSTLADIMAGILPTDKGKVLLNSHHLEMFNDAQKSRLIGLATQDIFLFSGTIRDNLLLGMPTATEEELTLALHIAQADSLLKQLPQGLDTKIHELGKSLSVGEKQRLSLARMIIMDSPILILDEATAFADPLTQQRFHTALKRHHGKKTIIFIAHRFYGIEDADQVILMDKGTVIAKGRHYELLATCPAYKDLYRLNQKGDNWELSASNGGIKRDE